MFKNAFSSESQIITLGFVTNCEQDNIVGLIKNVFGGQNWLDSKKFDKIWAKFGKIKAKFGQNLEKVGKNLLDLEKINILHPQKHFISCDYGCNQIIRLQAIKKQKN